MKIGAMNNPRNDLYEEIAFVGKNRFDFLDLTIEPETAYSDDVDTKKILSLAKKYRLGIIGHTPWNLPISSPYLSVRKAALYEYIKCIEVFRKLRVRLVNIHPFTPSDVSDPQVILDQNIDFLKKVTSAAGKHGITIMMENTKSIFNEVEVINKILEDVPALMLHWDVGHANLGNEAEKMTKLAFDNFRKKIVHLHVSDNNGMEDQHLPLGAGNINWEFIIKLLKAYKYNKTITLEIHSPDTGYLLLNKDKLKKLLGGVK